MPRWRLLTYTLHTTQWQYCNVQYIGYLNVSITTDISGTTAVDISLCHHSVAYLFLSLQLHSWQGLSQHCFFLSSDRLKLFVEPCKVYFENYNYNLDSFKELRFQGPTWRLYPINCTQHIYEKPRNC